MVWSDSPFSVSGSYSTPEVDVLDRRRSIQDLSFPLAKVWRADGPGCAPFRMFQPYNSHNSISHVALLLVVLSSLCLEMEMSFIVGDRSPTRAFQSPPTTWAV